MTTLEALQQAMAEVDAFYKERGIFQGRFGFGESPALVIIDMAYGWTDTDYAGGSDRLSSALDAIGQILPVARAKKIPIFYTTAVLHEEPPFKSAADYSEGFRKWDARACEIDSRVLPLPGEMVLAKEHASAFSGTPLVGELIAHRVDTLLITGCSTSACVRATATDAKSYHLRPVIVREAVQDRSEIAHEWTLFDIQARFADVTGLEDTLAYLNDLS